ncbi:MAG: hypothetical protein K6A44_01865 [bacterium]|nr:hypothetical protein [bacterium]
MKNIYVKEDNLFLEVDSRLSAENNVNKIKNVLHNVKSRKIYINLCGLNMFDAIKISSLISAYGLADDVTRKFEILADNKIVMGHIKLLGLSNLCVKMEEAQQALAAI